MGTELQTQDHGPVAQLYAKSLTSHECDKHRTWIAVKAEAVLRNFWYDTPDPTVKTEMLISWMNELEDFTPSEIRHAFSEHGKNHPTKKPNEWIIRKLMINRRGKAMRQINDPISEPEKPYEPRMTKEHADEVCAAAGFAPKRFGQ